MDPQKLSGLDPKLREAYQRVMGTTLTQPQQIPNTNPAIMPQPQPQTNNFDQMHSGMPASAPEPQAQGMVQKKGSIFTPILIGIGLLAGITIYTFVWTKILGFQLPFLPEGF